VSCSTVSASCMLTFVGRNNAALAAAQSEHPPSIGALLDAAAAILLLCCRAEARHDVSVFFIPERSILCERLLKQVSLLADLQLLAAAEYR
jgi:hypothetical protein